MIGRRFWLVVLFVASVDGLFADTILEQPLLPFTSKYAAQGFSGTVTDNSFASMFSNPASFYSDKALITILDTSMWFHIAPRYLLATILPFLDPSAGASLTDAVSLQATSNGIGAGLSAGFGYTGKGIGIGLSLVTDSYLYGKSFPLGIEGVIAGEYTIIVGGAGELNLWGAKITAGADVRPFIRAYTALDAESSGQLLVSMLGMGELGASTPFGEQKNTLTGYGLALDIGIRARIADSLILGAVLRDIGNTRLYYTRNTFNQAFSSFFLFSVPQGGDALSDLYIVPMSVRLGISWHPDLKELALLFDPTLTVEIADPFGWTDPSVYTTQSWLTRLHLGTELKLLNSVFLRAGINSGYLTWGLGFDLRYVAIDLASYTVERGINPGDRPCSGISINLNIRL
ncbi:hypothetical protein WKV44_08160 [Spirochaetia bacterium 38H-sp]|uniref:DUF5723 domain-containing protein n=1 Tax=Rarispira pelagica TaxID=3141764 RepID=A0ABU9UCW7_9SPIR